MWQPFDNRATVGQRGSEGGIIIRDEEYRSGARITLERDCAHGIPVTVTCGIYGWFFHTRFLGSEAQVEFPAMLDGLVEIFTLIPDADDPDADTKMGMVSEAISAFVSRFP